MGGGDVLDEMRGPYEPSNTPACAVEHLARRSDGESEPFYLRGECGEAWLIDIYETVIDLVLQR